LFGITKERTQYRRPVTRGDRLAVTLGLLVVAGGLAAGCGGGTDVMRATLTAEGCTYEGDTTPAPGVFTVEVRNETHNAAEFMVAELVEGAKIEEIEPWYEEARRNFAQGGPNTIPMPMKAAFTGTLVAAGATGEIPVNESSGRYVVLCTLDAQTWGPFGSRQFAATELNVQPTS
jgi:hypothetical protein